MFKSGDSYGSSAILLGLGTASAPAADAAPSAFKVRCAGGRDQGDVGIQIPGDAGDTRGKHESTTGGCVREKEVRVCVAHGGREEEEKEARRRIDTLHDYKTVHPKAERERYRRKRTSTLCLFNSRRTSSLTSSMF
jgi:hypothetical protein